LKIETTPRDDHQLKVVVEVETEVLERKMKKAARHIAEHTKIPGFRPGKAPYDMVVRYVGEPHVREEAVEMVVEEIYPQMLKEQNIEAGAVGSLEDIVSMDPLTLSFIVPLAPKVELNDYRSVRIPYEYKGIGDEDVEKVVEQYRSYYSTLEPLEKAAKEGNVVFLKTTGTSNGEEIVPERSLQVKIDEKSAEDSHEWPFQGFSRKLIGVKEGDEKDFKFTYPADFMDEKLKGKDLVFHASIQSVKKMVLPEVDEAFIKNFGDFAAVEDFKKNIRTQLEANSQAEYDFEYYNKVIDLIKTNAVIQYPPQVLDDEKQELIKSFERDLASQKMDMEAYLKLNNITREEFEEKELIPNAKKRLERTLIMNEIAHAEKIELSDKEMEEGYQQTLQDLASTTRDFDKLVKKMPRERLVNAIAMEAATRVMNRRVYETIKQIATGNLVEASPADAGEVEAKPKAKKTKPKTAKKEAVTTEGE
jgi:trigger factor